MTDPGDDLRDRASAAAVAVDSLDELRQARARFTGKKGDVTALLKQLGAMDPEERKLRGQEIHALKSDIDAIFDQRRQFLEDQARRTRLEAERIDVTLPGRLRTTGGLHPLESTARVVLQTLRDLGFTVEEGPEVEDARHNFDSLNFPPDHPAKEMQDTFFLADPFVDDQGAPLLLRTHTSPVQIRAMESYSPPLRIAAYGKVYRVDADVTHSPMFHQIEGFWVDRHINFRHLKGVLTELIQRVFGQEIPVRFRPSFFPFTEPSTEVDMGWQDGWMEVLGAGMIHPNVLRSVGIDPEQWQGFAFGLGIERFAMLRYGIQDIRLLYESDSRFLAGLNDRTVSR